ncbi:DUF2478 domain-containing protein [Halapricum sp. CBA1109]|uniref:nucleoside-triphosphatase n=1 Tax=Halapricum sp. CBA1109 TaxID=2668068 RepID=UPI0012FB3F73|nr:nucleoside-triphosphatase [Halapricum sp. CBA1109]MUV89446.1 DUF2478 domain-containing protein [Halapricum sp. CBA1109]
MNHLLTGPPRCGKTTALERTVECLRADGVAVGGVLTRERRRDGDRVGFVCRDLDSGEEGWLASVDREDGPRVGKYRVDRETIRDVVVPAVEAGRSADVLVVDEIAAMQCHSAAFVAAVENALAHETPLLASVATGSEGVPGAVTRREDVTVEWVREATRDAIPGRLCRSVSTRL